MKITLKDLNEVRGNLNKLLNHDDLTQKMKYRLRLLAKCIKKIAASEVELLKKHKANQGNGGFFFKKDQQTELNNYNKELEDYLKEEVEINYTPLSLKEMYSIVDVDDNPLIKLNTYDEEALIGIFIVDDINPPEKEKKLKAVPSPDIEAKK